MTTDLLNEAGQMPDTGSSDEAIEKIVDEAAPEEQKPEAQEPEEKPEPEEKEEKREDNNGTAELRKELARERRRIGNLTANKYKLQSELDALRAEIATLKNGGTPQPGATNATGKPDENDPKYKTYGEYLEDLVKWGSEQKMADLTAQQKRQAEQQQKLQEQAEMQEWRNERSQYSDDNMAKARAALADFASVEARDLAHVIALPQEIKDLFLENDNPAFAFYGLSKLGELDQLAGMTPTRAAMKIAQAEQWALNQRKQATRAPKPIAPAKGTAPVQKSIEQFTPEELKQWWNS